MNALDLSLVPPRSPRAPLADLDSIMAARSVDKVRATLPGGNLGAYQIQGFTERWLNGLGLAKDDFVQAVTLLATDAEIAAWLRERCTPQQFDEVNRTLVQRVVRDRIDDPDFLPKYPHAASLPLDTPLIDMLDNDDARAFAQP